MGAKMGIKGSLNPDFALGFVKRPLIAIKSGCLETESAAADMVKSKIATQ